MEIRNGFTDVNERRNGRDEMIFKYIAKHGNKIRTRYQSLVRVNCVWKIKDVYV